MSSFIKFLEHNVRNTDSLLCIGLDPHPADLVAATAQAARDFCLRLIEATVDLAAAYKPNTAFFEAFGSAGWAALEAVIQAAPDGVPLILDAKRGDIASTAEAYARAAFETLGADAITASPYLGYDAVEPFLRDPRRGLFLLCKTSNPGAGDLQDLVVSGGAGSSNPVGSEAGQAVYERVARLALGWNGNDNLGLVVGATHPEALKRVRAAAPVLWILAPGVGAQGGDLGMALRAGLRADGLGLLVPVSRVVSRADDPRQAAQSLRDEINRLREAGLQPGESQEVEPVVLQPGIRFSPSLAALAEALLEGGCVRFGEFTLKSGLQSPIYIDLRRLVGDPHLLSQAAEAYLPILRQLAFDRLAALPYAALPVATAVCLQGGWPLVYPRKEVKAYGTRAEVEGVYEAGERVVVIDDLATTGGSKFEAIEKLAAAGLQVQDVVVLIDRQSGATGALARAGYRLHAVFTLTGLLDHWEGAGRISAEAVDRVRDFLRNSGSEG